MLFFPAHYIYSYVYKLHQRYVYVPEDENSSKSIEIERVMRETRLRELVKGVYSSSYGESVNTKVRHNTFTG